MKKTYLQILILLLLLLLLLTSLFSGCSFSVSEVEGNPYSRENTIDLINGYSSSDYDYVTCKFIYNNDEIIEIYGNGFEISNILGSTDLKQSMWFFEGTAKCLVYIEDDIWNVKLEKGYFSDWKVIDCYKESQ